MIILLNQRDLHVYKFTAKARNTNLQALNVFIRMKKYLSALFLLFITRL